MKHHLTETHEDNLEIHNIALFSQSISTITLQGENVYSCVYTGKSHLPRRHTWAKFSKCNIPLSARYDAEVSGISP